MNLQYIVCSLHRRVSWGQQINKRSEKEKEPVLIAKRTSWVQSWNEE